MTIKQLVQKYSDNRNTYLQANYNETQLRIDFLDPLFELLGWDINNHDGKPTNEREVLVEEPLKNDANSNAKKPDYTFRLFSERKFFLEAKKPFVKINRDASAARQIRRYGFTAKLKISILSNFEYLAIYDCSKKVEKNDSSTNSRIKIYHYTEYESEFEKIKRQLGFESVYSGKFDDVWSEIESQLKLCSVDDLFLNQINEWRVILGKEIFLQNPKISSSFLNDIVQSYINSIIFLRVCEDRNIETYKTLLNFADNKDFNALIQKFKEADRKYNAGLFNHALGEELISNSKSTFWTIIKQLYYPESIYSFAVFSSDILGNIYEVFLGEKLIIEDGELILAKKPEHLDRDIVTTPTFIIQSILRETVSKYCSKKSPQDILSSTFADIACGSGAFLLETYQLLHDILIDKYLKINPRELVQIGISTFKLKFETKRKLIEKCIYGVDKDFNAVKACRFGLLLKLLEGENNNTLPVPALPSLDGNICYGNSLLDVQQTPEKSYKEINPYDFGTQQFDVIVGNPPYMATKHIKQITPLELPLFKKYFQSAFKQFDKYYLFIEKCLELLRENGYLGYIVPSKFTKVGSGKKIRESLIKNKNIDQIISFGANQIFQDKSTYTCILILQKKHQDHVKYIEIQSIKEWKTRDISIANYDYVNFDKLKSDGWLLVPGLLKKVYKSIVDQSQTLESIVGSEGIYNGIQTSANKVYIHKTIREDESYLYFEKDKIEWKIEKILTRPYFKTSSGSDNLYTYRPFKPNAFVIYPYVRKDDGIKFVNYESLKLKYPYAHKYLSHYKDILGNPKRDIKPAPETKDEWYRYGRHQSLDKCDVPAKIIVGVLSQGNKYAIDYHGTLISSGGTAGYCMITLPDKCLYSIYFIQALLNSKYLEWFSALHGEVFRGGYIARGTKVLKKLPIRSIDFSNPAENALHDDISELQKNMITLQEKIDKAEGDQRELTPLNRQFQNKQNEMDDLLRSLYNLEENDSLIPLITELYATN